MGAVSQVEGGRFLTVGGSGRKFETRTAAPEVESLRNTPGGRVRHEEFGTDSDDLPGELALAFAPLHKLAFGLAVGVTMGATLFLATAYCILRGGYPSFMDLIANYFPGYAVTWTGAVIGFAWATFAFSVAGWFCAYVRNLVLAVSIWITRTRAELYHTRDFLDHI